MKKNLHLVLKAFIICLLCSSTSVFAQKGLSAEVFIQPQDAILNGDYFVPGINSTNNFGWETLKKPFTFGFAAGADLEYNFTYKIGVSLGLMYSGQGQKFKNNEESGNFSFGGYSASLENKLSFRSTLNYVKIPVLFRYTQNPEIKISLSFYAGFYLGFLTSYTDEYDISTSAGVYDPSTSTYETVKLVATAKASGNVATATATETSSLGTYTDSQTYTFLTKPYTSSDAGLMLGLGMQIRLTDQMSLPIHLNYEYGFADIKNHSSQMINTSGNSSNSTEMYWGATDDPNLAEKFNNSVLGIRIGVKILL